MVAKVAFPAAVQGVYDYSVPERFYGQIETGTPVEVPLRSRMMWGMVVSVAEKSSYPSLKPINRVRSGNWTDRDRSLIKLYEWMSSYYHCSLGKVFRPLVRKGFIDTGARVVAVYTLSGDIPEDLTHGQRKAVELLRQAEKKQTRSALKRDYGVSAHMVDILLRKGAISRETKRIYREAGELSVRAVEKEVVELQPEQAAAVERIAAGFDAPSKPFLLYGITGSGKTHVYIELARMCMARGRAVIILVPEISLTPQTIRRFREDLGDVISVIHSRMSDGERRDSIEELVTGRKRVAIGVRSAVLVPMDNVGLIVVDEEHDQSYKQEDVEPRYHARDVAVMRGHFQKAVVVLGSATPSFESFRNGLTGKYEVVRLERRYGEASLPSVKVVDMNEERRKGNWTLLSKYLRERMENTLAGGKQIILLLNRRGFSVSLICKDCGWTYVCPHCSVNLVYHLNGGARLRCHLCGHAEPAPTVCVSCRGEQIKYRGTGIQKAEEYIAGVFPGVRIIRMDMDTTRRKGMHISIVNEFAGHGADILIGTQMVAKGLNFPQVRLVGVLQADTGLHFPDFRAAERTFQLLAQVAGRAGRKDSLGEVVVQTCLPGEPGIMATLNHDYEGFFRHEIDSRKALNYPPFSKLARIIVQGGHEEQVCALARDVSSRIRKTGDGKVELLGPSPAILSRLKGSYRYSCLIKSQSVSRLSRILEDIRCLYEGKNKKLKIIIDVDPVNML